ncbi:MAG: dTMP kinase [Desulfobacterales bacterium]|jgi:dTMP kinase
MFITLEGIEGSGKTTQIRQLSTYIEATGYRCVTTREPGGTSIGDKIRAILLNPENNDLSPISELLLYMADRAQHLNSLIQPALDAGKIVLCDRYFDATVVYQGIARGLDTELIYSLHRLLFEDLKPEVTFLLDLPPSIGLARAWKQIDDGIRSGGESRFEEETLAFHEKVRAGYLELARLEADRFTVIDATQDEKKVQMDIREVLSSVLSH